ncbi:MAG: hypothetical protein EPN97_05980 [Alphaproteobacteria bacterium]|nr:MAG: hypothetical protein EPN97_05980 [Alphaproteobacteria bacterium]
MGNFFGAIFKLVGGLVMVLSVVVGLIVCIALMAKTGSVRGNVWIIALVTAVPFLIGRFFYGIGRKLQQEDGEALTQPPPGNQARETVVTRRPAQSEFKRWKEAVDVDIAPETGPWASAAKPAPRKEAAPAPRRENKPDPFAMGVDTLYDPDKDGKGSAS